MSDEEQAQIPEEPSFMPPFFHPTVRGDAIAQAIKGAEEYMKPELRSLTLPDGTEVPVVLDKDGFTVLDDSQFDQFRESPRFRIGTAIMLTLDSFIAHVQRFANPETVVFADNDRSSPSLTAVIDYHHAGASGEARFGKHRTHHRFPLSDEWQAWKKFDGEQMKMVAFARFLEDHIIDVVPPHLMSPSESVGTYVDALGGTGRIADPAKLMDMAKGLEINESSIVREVHNLASGETTIEFQSEHRDKAGGKLKLPTMFVIGIPVFNSGEVYQILARLRYRKAESTIIFWYELWRTDLVFDHAFNEAVDRVASATSQPVLIGHPES